MSTLSYHGVFRNWHTSTITEMALGLTDARRFYLIEIVHFAERYKIHLVKCDEPSCNSCGVQEAFLLGLKEQDHFKRDLAWYERVGACHMAPEDAATAWETYRAS